MPPTDLDRDFLLALRPEVLVPTPAAGGAAALLAALARAGQATTLDGVADALHEIRLPPPEGIYLDRLVEQLREAAGILAREAHAEGPAVVLDSCAKALRKLAPLLKPRTYAEIAESWAAVARRFDAEGYADVTLDYTADIDDADVADSAALGEYLLAFASSRGLAAMVDIALRQQTGSPARKAVLGAINGALREGAVSAAPVGAAVDTRGADMHDNVIPPVLPGSAPRAGAQLATTHWSDDLLRRGFSEAQVRKITPTAAAYVLMNNIPPARASVLNDGAVSVFDVAGRPGPIVK